MEKKQKTLLKTKKYKKIKQRCQYFRYREFGLAASYGFHLIQQDQIMGQNHLNKIKIWNYHYGKNRQSPKPTGSGIQIAPPKNDYISCKSQFCSIILLFNAFFMIWSISCKGVQLGFRTLYSFMQLNPNNLYLYLPLVDSVILLYFT